MEHEISRRRTFAIISHPDAGKTTLTEKMLLYGGAVHLAGSVKARKNQRATLSDWMELEKKRGISISSTVLQFDYRGYCANLLDTPGHEDFSEDTYRVLTAVDAAVMVIDAGKGIENQTRKLFAFLQGQLQSGRPERYPAHVTDVRNFGFFVDVPGLAMSGLVPLSTVEDDFFVFEAARNQLVGRRTRRIIRLGDPVTVQVAKVDTFKKQVDFRLTADAGRPDADVVRLPRSRHLRRRG